MYVSLANHMGMKVNGDQLWLLLAMSIIKSCVSQVDLDHATVLLNVYYWSADQGNLLYWNFGQANR